MITRVSIGNGCRTPIRRSEAFVVDFDVVVVDVVIVVAVPFEIQVAKCVLP